MNWHQMIHKRDGGYEKSTDLVHKTLKAIRKACAKGSVDALETILKSLQSDKFSHYLNAMIRDYQLALETFYTPLMIASAHGHDSIVRFLLKNYSDYCIVDAQNYSSERDFDYHYDVEHLNKQTALWLAVRYKHLNVVQTLVSFSQVNINQKADDCSSVLNSTPLYLACNNKQLHMATRYPACNNEQLDMVKYLIENGADLYHVDNDDSTALMIASSRGYDEIVKYLLSLDENNNHLLNAVNSKGSTALHLAAYSARLSTVKLLLEEYHAKIVKDNEGFTPLTKAGINDCEELVKYFIEREKQSWYTISEVIDELEIIGSYQLERHGYCPEQFQRAFRYLMWAMNLRYKDPKVPILKTNLPSPIPAYGNHTECQTMEELTLIGKNSDHSRLILECLMIRERRGITSEFLKLLADQADLFGYDLYSFDPDTLIRKHGECQHALQLWLHAYHLRIQTQIDLYECFSHLKECVTIMGHFIKQKRTKEIRFDMVMKILQTTENEFIRNKNLPLKSDVKRKAENVSCLLNDIENRSYLLFKTDFNNGDKCLYLMLNLLLVAMKIVTCSKKKKEARRRIIVQRVQQLIQLNYHTISDHKTLLHFSLLEYHNGNYFGLVDTFPSLPVVELLLSCRAPINAIDRHHYTPLHDFAGNHFEEYTNEELGNMKRIFNLLVNAGAHLDAIAEGKTPEDCAKHDKLKSLFRKHPIQLNLKCICARIIQKNQLNYNDSIPKHLQSFVKIH